MAWPEVSVKLRCRLAPSLLSKRQNSVRRVRGEMPQKDAQYLIADTRHNHSERALTALG